MPQNGIMQAFGSLLCLLAELAFFNQWMLMERESCKNGYTAPVLVTLYAVSEKAGLYLLDRLVGDGLPPVVAMNFFLPHLILAYYAALFVEFAAIELPSNFVPFAVLELPSSISAVEPVSKKIDTGATNRLRIARSWELLILAVPTVTAAFSHVLLFDLAERAKMPDYQTSSAWLAFAYAAFLFCRSSDWFICGRLDRPLFVGQQGIRRAKFAFSMLSMMLAIRAALTWTLNLQGHGLIEKSISRWLGTVKSTESGMLRK